MEQSKENQRTFGKSKNSKVYIAGNANSVDKCDELETKSSRRTSVSHIRSVFEKTSPEKSAGKLQQSDSVPKGNLESSSQCFPEAQKSPEAAVPERRLSENQNVHNAWNNLPGYSDVSDGNLNNSEANSRENLNTATKSLKDMTDSEVQGSKSILPGSLLLQPASNVRGPVANAEYLKLNQFNDITVYPSSKRRSKVNVDELDKKMDECLPVTCIDEALVDSSLDDTEDPQAHFDPDFAFVFEGDGIKVNRPALKTRNSQHKKQVRFCHHPASVFEYPSEKTTLKTLAPEQCDSNSSNINSINTEHDRIIPDRVISKTLQSSPICSGTGCLGMYQPRLLEQYSVIPFYGADAFSDHNTKQQSTINSQPVEKFKAKATVVSSCSAEESSWSGGNSGTELLF